MRDGGYCNQWKFGYKNIKKITNSLAEAALDIIECGFITNTVTYDRDTTRFNTVEQIKEVIPENRSGRIFVAMMNYGEYDIGDLPECDHTSIDGIRVAFHKKNLVDALALCHQIKEKGYLVFIQAMVSLSYSDEEFLDLIRRTNELKPYSFYIVDSFGMMKRKDLVRLFYMVEHNLSENIWIGFHSHNNMQLAFSNAQTLTTVQTNRNLIIDSSVYGMGRGAGNLNTELFVEFLNENAEKNYNIKPLLTIIDEILNEFYQKNSWGYSLPNYLSASHNAHPNYAEYLDDRKTLTVEDMNEIFKMMDPDKKIGFDKKYIEELYLKYMARGQVQEEHKRELKELLRGKTVLLVAPGKSSTEEADKVNNYMTGKDVITVGVNFDYDGCDYVFLSNLRRFRELEPDSIGKCIVTSNILAENAYLQTKYEDLINDEEAVKDNAGLMAIKFFENYDVQAISLAGFDGYSHDLNDNYGNSHLEFITRNAVLDAINVGLQKIISAEAKRIKIEFVTTPKHVKI